MKYFCIWLLKLYKRFVSPVLGKSCIFTPTCSVYAMEAFKEFGCIRGFWLTAKRLARCAPWGRGGLEPIPYNFRGDLKWIL